ncbi:MAG TPA: outer membrane beta-barrel protein [Rhodocyclaceae bacterium]|nr:outer membrane beta-barrel protein [Rhodocyclaceae bacterium]
MQRIKQQTRTRFALARLSQPWKVVSVVASVAIFSMSAARADENQGWQGWYAGVNAGVGHSSLGDGGVNSALGKQGISADSSVDSHDNIYGLNLGYRFRKNFAVEGGYVDLGKYNFSSNVSAPAADAASGDYRVKGWTASAVGILPLQNGFSAYGKVGLIVADTKLNAGSDSGANAIGDSSHTSTRPTYGLGLAYDFSKQVVGKVEWNRYENLGNGDTGKSDLDAYTVGVAYKF